MNERITVRRIVNERIRGIEKGKEPEREREKERERELECIIRQIKCYQFMDYIWSSKIPWDSIQWHQHYQHYFLSLLQSYPLSFTVLSSPFCFIFLSLSLSYPLFHCFILSLAVLFSLFHSLIFSVLMGFFSLSFAVLFSFFYCLILFLSLSYSLSVTVLFSLFPCLILFFLSFISLMVRFQSLNLGKYEVPLYFHYPQVLSDPQWLYVFGSNLCVKYRVER